MLITTSYCTVDQLFYVNSHNNTIHTQKTEPSQEEIFNAVVSDQWNSRFNDMKNGNEVRVSDRIWDDMLESVPPLKFQVKPNSTSFFCGEPYSDQFYYFFERRNGFRYGSIRHINTGELFAKSKRKLEVN